MLTDIGRIERLRRQSSFFTELSDRGLPRGFTLFDAAGDLTPFANQAFGPFEQQNLVLFPYFTQGNKRDEESAYRYLWHG